MSDSSAPDSPKRPERPERPESPGSADQPDGSDVGGHGRPRRRALTVVIAAVAILLVGALSAAAVYVYRINESVTRNIHRSDTLPSDDSSGAGSASPRPSKDPQATGTLNYVLLGSDSRTTGNSGEGRSDSIMVVHLNAARNKAYVISLPRDMWVNIPGYGHNKINAAFRFGGAKLTVRTIEELTGVRMDHVVMVDFEGFISLTKDLGGITVKNKVAFTSHGYTYRKGRITISGKKALWFVRERHAFPRGDLDRAANQRNVIKAIVAKGLSAEIVSDPTRFTSFLANMAKHLTVDETLSDAEIRETAVSLRLSAKDIVLLQAPLSGFAMIDGQSVDVVDTAKLAELSKAMQTDTMAAYVKKHPKG